MDTVFALLLPIAVGLVAAAVGFGGRAARPMAITAFVLAVLVFCYILVRTV